MKPPSATELLHAKVYDPVKAREYYLRTRELKGRKGGSGDTINSKKVFNKAATGNEGTYKRPTPTKSNRQEELAAQRAALQKRLERLRDVLAELVEAAKKRSGVETKPEDTPKDKASRNEAAKKEKPLTAKQKAEKAEKAREDYEKESGGSSLSKDVAQLQSQIADIQKQIQAAMAKARENSSSPKPKTAAKGR